MELQNGVRLPIDVAVRNRDWHLFIAEFDSADGKFSFYFYALSFEHAAALLQELKETATLLGQMGAVIPAKNNPSNGPALPQ
jgi:hypothetical protein